MELVCSGARRSRNAQLQPKYFDPAIPEVVSVVSGERPEAMQTGAAMLPSRSNTVAALTVAAFIAIMGPLALHFGDR